MTQLSARDEAWIEAELAKFEVEQAEALGLHDRHHWSEPVHTRFTETERPHTTVLFGGFTLAHDTLIASAMRGLGYRIQNLPCPDGDALATGKEFGNRGQCNPTYFTVGNLVQHLVRLRDEAGIPAETLVKEYLFVTTGACGPCRFGMYATEYRKALRDAGFDGFRVLLFQQQGGLKQATGESDGLRIDAGFALAFTKALLVGDILNLLGYRIRPYELNPGDTDAALAECHRIAGDALERRRSVTLAMARCRRVLAGVAVDRSTPKPVVSVIGEFWAMTTEGAGNYHLQRFLEQEGAEVDIQPIVNWLLYLLWDLQFDIDQRLDLREADAGVFGLAGTDPTRSSLGLAAMGFALRGVFQVWANIAGLHGYALPDMDAIARCADGFYDPSVKGGEGHMEVGKLVHFAEDAHNHLTISVKPFGCMPSSGVSDGVQSLVTARFPNVGFLAIETTGDGEVNVQSRVQMALFKARQKAEEEHAEALAAAGLTQRAFQQRLAKSRWARTFLRPAHRVAASATNLVHALGSRSQSRHV
ncbi:MAG: 2-hydroxyglutaryl-CoA dehydratase [Alphaproteobacteria bacterium]|nr:2-hydroxyglutaryl-CoA dehydratase [Alphaproteobacteria bacterium]